MKNEGIKKRQERRKIKTIQILELETVRNNKHQETW